MHQSESSFYKKVQSESSFYKKVQSESRWKLYSDINDKRETFCNFHFDLSHSGRLTLFIIHVCMRVTESL